MFVLQILSQIGTFVCIVYAWHGTTQEKAEKRGSLSQVEEVHKDVSVRIAKICKSLRRMQVNACSRMPKICAGICILPTKFVLEMIWDFMQDGASLTSL